MEEDRRHPTESPSPADTGAKAPSDREGMEHAVGELSVALEELRVAEEELRHQNDELVAAQEAVQEERGRYQELFESAPAGYLVTDLAGRIRQANAAAGRLLGRDPKQLMGMPLTLYVAAGQSRAFRARLAEAAQGAEMGELEASLEPPGCPAVDVALSVSLRRNRGGAPAALWWVLQDISERRRAEEEVRALNADLERRVHERTARLQEADEAKDRFLAMLAHELRNPLGAILTATELLHQADLTDPRLRRARETIERQVRHQARLLDDLLSVTRIARGRIALAKERVDLRKLVCEAANDWEEPAQDAGLRLQVQTPPGPVWVDADPTRIAQVLDNLLHNAVKFTPASGEVALSLDVRDDRGCAVVRVRDTGVGIAPELLPRLFTAFTQAEQPLDRARGGLGLGLALVKGLVEMHGGEVTAASEGRGKGAEFTLLLPLATAREEAAPAPTQAPPEAPARILLIDDNRDAMEVLQDLLELHGHQVAVAYTGESGIELAHQLHPDVVVCDIGLPGMDGYAVARSLRADPATAAIRLVAVSGYAQEQDRRRSREAGFDLHLAKPVDLDDLERALAGATPPSGPA